MKLVIIRHSEPDYSFIKKGMSCQWSNLAPLSENGIEIAKKQKENSLIQDGRVICSPYTRALQTAHILFPDREITVEPMLHEWLPDRTFQVEACKVGEQNKKYKAAAGKHVTGDEEWEDVPEMTERIMSVIDKYKDTEEKIIIVAHERLLNTLLTEKRRINFCEIIELPSL